MTKIFYTTSSVRFGEALRRHFVLQAGVLAVARHSFQYLPMWQERLARIYGYGKAELYACGIGQCVSGYGEQQEVILIGLVGLPGYQILR